jgi:hypothetical protein
MTTRRELKAKGVSTRSAYDIAANIPGVRIVGASDPDAVTIDTSPTVANILRTHYSATHVVELEIFGHTQSSP